MSGGRAPPRGNLRQRPSLFAGQPGGGVPENSGIVSPRCVARLNLSNIVGPQSCAPGAPPATRATDSRSQNAQADPEHVAGIGAAIVYRAVCNAACEHTRKSPLDFAFE